MTEDERYVSLERRVPGAGSSATVVFNIIKLYQLKRLNEE